MKNDFNNPEKSFLERFEAISGDRISRTKRGEQTKNDQREFRQSVSTDPIFSTTLFHG